MANNSSLTSHDASSSSPDAWSSSPDAYYDGPAWPEHVDTILYYYAHFLELVHTDVDPDLWPLIVAGWFYIIGLPVLCFAGLSGNICSIVLLRRRELGGTTTAVMIQALAVFDSLSLVTVLANYWPYMVYAYDINTNPVLCPLSTYCMHVFTNTGSWLLLPITLERCVAVISPFNMKKYFNMKLVLVYMVSILVFMMAVNAHMLYAFRVQDFGGALYCEVIPGPFLHFFNHTWPWIDITIYAFVPMSALFVGNSAIIVKIIIQAVKRKKNSQAAAVNVSNITLVLMFVTITFLVTNFPMMVLNIANNPFDFEGKTKQEALMAQLYLAVFTLTTLFSNSVNFWLFVVGSPRFRAELVKVLRGLRIRRKVADSSSGTGESGSMKTGTKRSDLSTEQGQGSRSQGQGSSSATDSQVKSWSDA